MLIDAIVRTTRKSFKLGEARIQAILCLLLMAPALAGSCIQSVLDMRFGDLDLLVVLARDSHGGPHKLPRYLLNLP